MSRFRIALTLTCVLALPMALGGCAGVLVVGGLTAAGGAGYAAAQERGVDGSVDDFQIKMEAEQALLRVDPNLQAGITTTVYGGRVLLTGRLPNEQTKMAAAQAVGRVKNVRAVFNEVEVQPPDNSMWNGTSDAWITTQVRSEMVLDSDIRSVNYSIDTANGSVYLMGSARSQNELDHATKVARYVPGVRRVVSYVELRAGSPVASVPASPRMAPMAPGPAPMGGGAPSARIEVQKL